MDSEFISNSSLSLDSLEIESKRKSLRKKGLDENVDTILVPLYDKDVLIKVPKSKQKHSNRNKNSGNKKEDCSEPQNYLVNKEFKKGKKTSYLEMFRNQFTPNVNKEQNEKISNEIRSLSPEFGDSERESFGFESYDPENDFYNTEAYNEIYYDKILKAELEQYLDKSFEQALHFDEDITKCEDDVNGNNLRSISEVSQPRRRTIHKNVPLMQNIRLGGLGPDIENIKPRLERARSLQRYSEKVRMENRLKIYKKGVENEKIEREASATRRQSIQKQSKEQTCNKKKSSYLVNNIPEKQSLIKKNCNSQSKSADFQKLRQKEQLKIEANKVNKITAKYKEDRKTTVEKQQEIQKNEKSARENYTERYRLKSSAKKRERNKEINENESSPPLQISFLVNVGGARPTSALRSLEDKHRMYQEKVKAYCTDLKNP